jgi:outer membrane biosynthesis protein TonB
MFEFILNVLIVFVLKIAAAEVNAKSTLWLSYVAAMQQKVKKNWRPPSNPAHYQILLAFNIHRDGHVSNLNVKGHPEKNITDAAVNAVRQASPFSRLPRQYKGETVAVNFTIDYWPQKPKR